MLKKLVKYGNSNALVIDKAILELLDIEEGSIVKIRTDGTSIIITPHAKIASEKISEPFTHEQATVEASVQEYIQQHKGLDADRQEELKKEFVTMTNKLQDLYLQISKNPEFAQELAHIIKTTGGSSPEYIQACKALYYKFAPELPALEQEMATFQAKNKLSIEGQQGPVTELTEEQKKAMEQEFFVVHKKNMAVYKAHAELLHNAEYQHQAQLLAEKYKDNHNSAEYLMAANELIYSYIPEYRQAQEDLQAIGKRYATTN